MLTTKALHYYEKFLEFGCLICIFPYKWDKKERRLFPSGRRVLFIFHYYLTLILCATTFFAVRFLMAHKKGLDHFPLFAKVFNAIWLLACIFSSVCIYQVKTCRHVSMAFHNTLLSHWRKTQDDGSNRDRDDGEEAKQEAEQDPAKDNNLELAAKDKLKAHISGHVVLQIWNFVSAIPSHSVGIFLSPCSPNFISSLILPCATEGSMVWFPLVIPFFFYESLVVLVNITIWMFCWFGIFLGLAWIYWELMDVSMKPWDSSMVPEVIHTYKKLQTLMAQMNSSFQFYLSYFSSMMFALIAFAIYGSFRLFGVDWRSIVFVSCMIRCGFESVTPLIIAGNVNHKSKEIMRKLRENVDPFDKGMRRDLKSLTPLQTRAGSFYTYENSIVLTCMESLILLVLNLLIMF